MGERIVARELTEDFEDLFDGVGGLRAELVTWLSGRTISETVFELNKLWLDAYQETAKQINSGSCEIYSAILCQLFPGAESFWGDELLTPRECTDAATYERFAFHCITRHKGRYYDSECPYGVDDFRDIPCFHRAH